MTKTNKRERFHFSLLKCETFAKIISDCIVRRRWGISQFSHLSYIEKNGEVNGLLSNQILQRTINEIGDIIECNCSIWNTDGVMLAAVGKEKPAVKKLSAHFKRAGGYRRIGGAPG